jgi:putative flippase GtrA
MVKREITIFFIIGILTVIIDFTLYRFVILLGLNSIQIAKGIGFVGGTGFAYLANRSCTFKGKVVRSGSGWRFFLVYSIGLVANIIINSLCIFLISSLAIFEQSETDVIVAFIVATSFSATLNFLGMKYFVFTN